MYFFSFSFFLPQIELLGKSNQPHASHMKLNSKTIYPTEFSKKPLNMSTEFAPSRIGKLKSQGYFGSKSYMTRETVSASGFSQTDRRTSGDQEFGAHENWIRLDHMLVYPRVHRMRMPAVQPHATDVIAWSPGRSPRIRIRVVNFLFTLMFLNPNRNILNLFVMFKITNWEQIRVYPQQLL